MTKILVVGSGAREHALLWKLAQSPRQPELYCAPGNAGTASLAENVPIGSDDVTALARWADERAADVTVVGPESPLARGLADALAARRRAVFGPTQAAAIVESSKAWTKALLERHGIPTARARIVADLEAGRRALDEFGLPVVVKADGLAAGKGVVVATTRAEAEAALHDCLTARVFGTAGDRVLVEEFLTGPEVSVLAFADGQCVVPMVPACDYKRVGEGDTGPNTGGMGAYAPPALMTPELRARVQREILEPTLAALVAEGRPYQGVLYAGLMLTPDGPKVLEFNCRFGDPETQVVLPLLASDLVDIVEAAAEGHLDQASVRWRADAACGVVLAAPGYPGPYQTGVPISGLDQLPAEALAFHAGTGFAVARRGDAPIVTAGGRVLTVVGTGADREAARTRAYAAAERIWFEGVHFRRDIAAVERGAAAS